MFWTVVEVTIAWLMLVAVVMGMLRAAARADRAAAAEENELIASLRRMAMEQLRDTPGLVAPTAGSGHPLSR